MRRLRGIVLACVVLAATAELALRVGRFGWTPAALGPWSTAPPWDRLRTFDAAGDPQPIGGAEAAWSLGPGEPVVRYRLNRLGLREEREPADRAAPGTCRILAAGDAYTFGYGVTADDAWPRRLARRLAGERVEVLNAGFPNLDVEQQRRRVARLAARLRPDVVVVNFDWWNVPLEAAETARPPRWSRAWWIANVEQKGARLGAHVALADVALRMARARSGLFPQSGLARELEPLTVPPAALASRWARTRAALAGMASDAAASGGHFLLVVTPLDVQVDPRRNALYVEGRLPYPAHGFADVDYRAARAMPEALARFTKANDIAVLDLTATFAARPADDLFLPDDYHAGPGAQGLIAEAVERRLRETGACALRPTSTVSKNGTAGAGLSPFASTSAAGVGNPAPKMDDSRASDLARRLR